MFYISPRIWLPDEGWDSQGFCLSPSGKTSLPTTIKHTMYRTCVSLELLFAFHFRKAFKIEFRVNAQQFVRISNSHNWKFENSGFSVHVRYTQLLISNDLKCIDNPKQPYDIVGIQ